MKRKLFVIAIAFIGMFCLFAFQNTFFVRAEAFMPFYDLRPQKTVLRAEFYTTYSSSSDERKNNIEIAAKALNNTLIDVGGEFSFNRTVGARTEKRGYKTAKIIVGGEFTEGVGGGVCQVSTTLYNAFLVAGLKITEYHPHSLAVSYIALSFDAMVNSGSADLRCINTTHNPIIIKTFADGKTLRIKIYGEPMKEKYIRQSVTVEEIAPITEVIKDTEGLYKDLAEGENMVLSYGKKGYVTEGYLIKTVNGKEVYKKRIRRDRYGSIKCVVIEGTAKKSEETEIPSENIER